MQPHVQLTTMARLLAKTFIDTGPLAAMSYESPNKRRGKLDREHSRALPAKDLSLAPLHRGSRRILTAPA